MLRSSRSVLGSLLFAVGLLGCAPDEVGGPPDGGSGIAVTTGTASSFASCQAGLIALTPGNGLALSELSSLANGFNNAVFKPGLTTTEENKLRSVGAYNPGAVPPGVLRSITVTKDSSGSGTGWCGDNDGFDDITVEWCSSGGPGDPTAFQNRRTTILHELWNIMNNNTNKLSNWDAAAGCSLHPASDPTTTVPCVHEVQFEYDFCGVRPQSLTADVDLYTGVDISGPSTLEEQQSAQYTASFMDTGGGGGPVAALVQDPAVVWSSSSHLSLSSTTANPTTATGAQVGSGEIRVTLPAAGNVVYPLPTRTRPVNVEADSPPSCTYSPSGSVQIDIGEVQTFLASSLNCSGYTATLSPANGTVGFSRVAGCSLTSIDARPVIKVRGCQSGSATLTIRQNGVLIQTINLHVGS